MSLISCELSILFRFLKNSQTLICKFARRRRRRRRKKKANQPGVICHIRRDWWDLTTIIQPIKRDYICLDLTGALLQEIPSIAHFIWYGVLPTGREEWDAKFCAVPGGEACLFLFWETTASNCIMLSSICTNGYFCHVTLTSMLGTQLERPVLSQSDTT